MFEQLIVEAASRFNVSTRKATVLLRELLGMMTYEQSGGFDGFLGMFRSIGLADTMATWLGSRQGRALTPTQVESALGWSTIDSLAASTGLSRAAVSSATAFMLPRLIGHLTPGGMIPSTSTLLSQVSAFLDRPVSEPYSQSARASAWPPLLPWTVVALLLAIGGWFALRGTPGTIDPQLTVSDSDDKITNSSVARDESTRSQSAIGTSGVSPTAVVQAMNQAIITFPSGSAQMLAQDIGIIRQLADALTQAPQGTKIEIGGHTDNTGDAESNLRLSQQRADAVRDALTSAGVSAEMLTTMGYGATRPRAQNDTELENRRIEYSIVQ